MKKYELLYRTTSMGKYNKKCLTKRGALRFAKSLCPIIYFQISKNGTAIHQEIIEPLTFFDELQQDGITLLNDCIVHSKKVGKEE